MGIKREKVFHALFDSPNDYNQAEARSLVHPALTRGGRDPKTQATFSAFPDELASSVRCGAARTAGMPVSQETV